MEGTVTIWLRLPPVTFDKHVIVPPMVPTMIHPSGASVRRRHPHARRPHVRVSIPAMIPTLVDIAGLRSPAPYLDHRARRRYLHNNLFAHRADRQQTAGNRGKNCSSHFFPFNGRAATRHICFAINFAKLAWRLVGRPILAAAAFQAALALMDRPKPGCSQNRPPYRQIRKILDLFIASGLRRTRSRAHDAPSDDPPIGPQDAAARPIHPVPTRARVHPSDDSRAGRPSPGEEPCRAPRPPDEAAPLAR
jgi:hypothetical protein